MPASLLAVRAFLLAHLSRPVPALAGPPLSMSQKPFDMDGKIELKVAGLGWAGHVKLFLLIAAMLAQALEAHHGFRRRSVPRLLANI